LEGKKKSVQTNLRVGFFKFQNFLRKFGIRNKLERRSGSKHGKVGREEIMEGRIFLFRVVDDASGDVVFLVAL
jgi:hypothetical protein